MTPDTMTLLWMAAASVATWWFKNWTGPLATRLRELFGKPAPAPSPLPGGFDLDAIRRLIPDVPDAVWDDVARAALDALAKRLQAAPPAAKLPLVRRLLDLAEHVDEPPALQA